MFLCHNRSMEKSVRDFNDIDFGFLASRYEPHIKKRLEEYKAVNASKVRDPLRNDRELKRGFGRQIYLNRKKAKTFGKETHGTGRGFMTFGISTIVMVAIPLFIVGKTIPFIVAAAALAAIIWFFGNHRPIKKTENEIMKAAKEQTGLDHGQATEEQLNDAYWKFFNTKSNKKWIDGIYDYFKMNIDGAQEASIAKGFALYALIAAAAPTFYPIELIIGVVAFSFGFLLEKQNTKDIVDQSFKDVFKVTDPLPA